MSSYMNLQGWIRYFENMLSMCCKVVNWEYSLKTRSVRPPWIDDYKKSVIEQINKLTEAREKEFPQDRDIIKNGSDRILEEIKGNRESLINIIDDNYDELKRLLESRMK